MRGGLEPEIIFLGQHALNKEITFTATKTIKDSTAHTRVPVQFPVNIKMEFQQNSAIQNKEGNHTTSEFSAEDEQHEYDLEIPHDACNSTSHITKQYEVFYSI
jgi:hypothetical protein